MSEFTGTFDAAEQSSNALPLEHNQGLAVTLTEGAAEAWAVVLERAVTPGLGWVVVATYAADQVATQFINTSGEKRYFRLRCISNPEEIEIDYTLADLAGEVIFSFKNPITGVDEITFTDQGVKINRNLDVDGNLNVDGSGGPSNPSTLVIPSSATPSQTTEGQAVWDSDDDVLTIGTGAARKTMVDADSTQTLTNKTLTTPVINGAMTGTATALKVHVFNTGEKVGATAGWVVNAATNVGRMATLPAEQTASTLVVRIPKTRNGDIITSFFLLGQIESAGGAVTVDAELFVVTTAAGDIVTTSLGAITQLAVTADTAVTATNASKTLDTPSTAGADRTYYILITATTAASTDIDLIGVAIGVTEKLTAVVE